jgi:signal transduction histidine kinase
MRAMIAESRSIRHSVTWRFSVFALVLSLIYSLLIIFVAFIVEDQVIENLLETEAKYMQTYFSMNEDLPAPTLDFVSIYPSLDDAAKSLPGKIEVTGRDEEIFVDGPLHYHIKKITLKHGSKSRSIVMLAEVGNLLSVSRLSAEIIALFAFILLLGLLLAVWQALTLANKTTQPISALANSVAQLASKRASNTIKVAPTDNEIVYLSTVIDSVFFKLEQSLDREQAFTQDVSHELRTPLTVVQNTLSLIEQRGWRKGDQDALVYATDKMQTTINTLLIMAREGACYSEEIPLRPILEQTILNNFQRLEAASIRVSLHVDEKVVLVGNADLITLIVVNLLENTIAHSPHCELSISANPDNLIFKNTLSKSTCDGPAQHKHGGSGLGLILVKRMAEQMKWEMKVISDADYFCVSFFIKPSP